MPRHESKVVKVLLVIEIDEHRFVFNSEDKAAGGKGATSDRYGPILEQVIREVVLRNITSASDDALRFIAKAYANEKEV
jgi:hypothetical protein